MGHELILYFRKAIRRKGEQPVEKVVLGLFCLSYIHAFIS